MNEVKFVVPTERFAMKMLKRMFLLGVGFFFGMGTMYLLDHGLSQTSQDVSQAIDSVESALSQDAPGPPAGISTEVATEGL